MRPHHKAEHMAAHDQIVKTPKTPCHAGAVHTGTYQSYACRRNIEMTPLCKVQMALSCFSGLQEDVPYDGGVDERQGVFPA